MATKQWENFLDHEVLGFGVPYIQTTYLELGGSLQLISGSSLRASTSTKRVIMGYISHLKIFIVGQDHNQFPMFDQRSAHFKRFSNRFLHLAIFDYHRVPSGKPT